MTVNKITMCLAACFLLTASALPAAAQFGSGAAEPISSDLQFFSPVELDFDNLPKRKESGLFFRYDKLSWAVVGETTTVGDPNVTALSEIIFPGNPGDQGLSVAPPIPPAQFNIVNGLQEVAPDADFGWGERYEFGKTVDGSTWMIGIIDGPRVTTGAVYGFGPALNGFGSVHVNFATPPGFLLGFRDFQIQSINGANLVTGQNNVVTGPGGVADGIVDDIDGDALNGFFFFGIDVDGNGMIDDDEVTGNGVDFGDLHLFNIRFDTFEVRNVTETQGIEIMRNRVLVNRHKLATRQNNQWEIGYGVRFFRIRDSFFFQGTGDLLGLTQSTTSSENQIVGPQIRSRWTTRRGRWNVDIDGRFVFGYNVQDIDQVGDIGQNLVPGGLNSLLQGQPTSFSYGRQDNDFSPLVELRADASYQVTNSIALRLGYTAIFADNVTRASQIVQYSLPGLGILEGGNQEIFINGANFGFDVLY